MWEHLKKWKPMPTASSPWTQKRFPTFSCYRSSTHSIWWVISDLGGDPRYYFWLLLLQQSVYLVCSSPCTPSPLTPTDWGVFVFLLLPRHFLSLRFDQGFLSLRCRIRSYGDILGFVCCLASQSSLWGRHLSIYRWHARGLHIISSRITTGLQDIWLYAELLVELSPTDYIC